VILHIIELCFYRSSNIGYRSLQMKIMPNAKLLDTYFPSDSSFIIIQLYSKHRLLDFHYFLLGFQY